MLNGYNYYLQATSCTAPLELTVRCAPGVDNALMTSLFFRFFSFYFHPSLPRTSSSPFLFEKNLFAGIQNEEEMVKLEKEGRVAILTRGPCALCHLYLNFNSLYCTLFKGNFLVKIEEVLAGVRAPFPFSKTNKRLCS
jgi:hypothetical protein